MTQNDTGTGTRHDTGGNRVLNDPFSCLKIL